ncbi:hypothetical protein [Nitriliruptor alkaliphilus]|uniref:hypothetical protein n=1 Tax=Nitriliruptor alkaliphilus TaxID=427918 RepID=UPI0006963FEE|nr:hypothetical protein [Nitriliruptor alkaliphilus]
MIDRIDALLERLADWERRGLISAHQVAAIAAYERGRVDADVGRATGRDATGRGAARRDRTTAAEAIGYVGAALVLGAVGLFVGEFWDGLTAGGQLALALLVTLSLGAAAAVLRGAASPAIGRLTSVLSVGVVAGLAWSTSIATGAMLGWHRDDVSLTVGLVAVAAALPLYLARRRALPQLTLLVAGLTLLAALLDRPDLSLDTFWHALPFAVVGAVWVLLGEGGYLAPRTAATSSGSVLALLSLQVASFDDARALALVLALMVAGGLVAAAVTIGGLHHLGIGAAGLFVIVPQLVFELFGDAIGAPATLLLVGVLLVLLAVGLGRAKREVAASEVAGSGGVA